MAEVSTSCQRPLHRDQLLICLRAPPYSIATVPRALEPNMSGAGMRYCASAMLHACPPLAACAAKLGVDVQCISLDWPSRVSPSSSNGNAHRPRPSPLGFNHWNLAPSQALGLRAKHAATCSCAAALSEVTLCCLQVMVTCS